MSLGLSETEVLFPFSALRLHWQTFLLTIFVYEEKEAFFLG